MGRFFKKCSTEGLGKKTSKLKFCSRAGELGTYDIELKFSGN
jgi:hypothetical protein